MSAWICRLCEASGDARTYEGARHAYERHYLRTHSRDLERERRRVKR